MIHPSPYRRTVIVTHWKDGSVSLSGCVTDENVLQAIVSRISNDARVPYIIRCRRKPDLTEPGPKPC